MRNAVDIHALKGEPLRGVAFVGEGLQPSRNVSMRYPDRSGVGGLETLPYKGAGCGGGQPKRKVSRSLGVSKV